MMGDENFMEFHYQTISPLYHSSVFGEKKNKQPYCIIMKKNMAMPDETSLSFLTTKSSITIHLYKSVDNEFPA